MSRGSFTRAIALLALTAGVSLAIAGPPAVAAVPALAQEEGQGKGIAESLRAGEKRCADLSGAEFELVGEYAMGRYLGSEATHGAMNRRMLRMTGATGERRMHVALGHRYSSCPGGPPTGWVGPMAGMMGGIGVAGRGPDMMNVAEAEERGGYAGTMMGSGGHGSDLSTLGIVLVALASAALGAGAATLLPSGRRSKPR